MLGEEFQLPAGILLKLCKLNPNHLDNRLRAENRLIPVEELALVDRIQLLAGAVLEIYKLCLQSIGD